MVAARPLRDVFTELTGDETVSADDPAGVLREHGHPDLPDGLVAEAVVSFADTAPIEVAAHLAGYVAEHSPVPLSPSADSAAPGPGAGSWLDQLTSAPVGADELAGSDPAAGLDPMTGRPEPGGPEPGGPEPGGTEPGGPEPGLEPTGPEPAGPATAGASATLEFGQGAAGPDSGRTSAAHGDSSAAHGDSSAVHGDVEAGAGWFEYESSPPRSDEPPAGRDMYELDGLTAPTHQAEDGSPEPAGPPEAEF